MSDKERQKLEEQIEAMQEDLTEMEFSKTELDNSLKATKKRVVSFLLFSLSLASTSLNPRMSIRVGNSRETDSYVGEGERSTRSREGSYEFDFSCCTSRSYDVTRFVDPR
jgi:predicted nuclease with TOPRIM domain